MSLKGVRISNVCITRSLKNYTEFIGYILNSRPEELIWLQLPNGAKLSGKAGSVSFGLPGPDSASEGLHAEYPPSALSWWCR